VIEILSDLGERFLVDHRTHEVPEIRNVTNAKLLHDCHRAVAHLRPDRLGHVDPAGGGALLSLVLEPSARDRD